MNDTVFMRSCAVGWERRARRHPGRDAERRRDDAVNLAPRQEGRRPLASRDGCLQDELPVRTRRWSPAPYSGDAASLEGLGLVGSVSSTKDVAKRVRKAGVAR